MGGGGRSGGKAKARSRDREACCDGEGGEVVGACGGGRFVEEGLGRWEKWLREEVAKREEIEGVLCARWWNFSLYYLLGGDGCGGGGR